MVITIRTENGHMMINTEMFFPANKKDLRKLKKAIIEDEDRKAVVDAISQMISGRETYLNNVVSRANIHSMSLLEYVEGTFNYAAEKRIYEFYKKEADIAKMAIRELSECKEYFK